MCEAILTYMSPDLKNFNELFSEYRHRFIRFAMSYISNEAAAEDIVMESFMVYWEQRSRLRPDTNPPAYIFNTVKYKCLNYLRAQGIRQEAGASMALHNRELIKTRIATLEACDPEKLFSAEVTDLIKKGLDSLPQRTRDIFIMSRYHDKSHIQIAEELGIPLRTVEYEISKALKVLRERLKDYS